MKNQKKNLTSFYFAATVLLLVEELQTPQDATLLRYRLLLGATTGRRRAGSYSRRGGTVAYPNQIVHSHLLLVHIETPSIAKRHGMRG